MCDNDTVGAEFELKRDKIREFLRRPTHKGGILLVTGQRGTGKTRLVEEALSEERHDAGLLLQISQIFGGVGKRRRYSITRKPRELRRVLLKVDIDPLFPHMGEEADANVNRDPVNLLMRNIVCGITSVIDSRYSARRHGKTLRERLGFRGYWIENALLWKDGCGWGWAWLLFGLVFIYALQCLSLNIIDSGRLQAGLFTSAEISFMLVFDVFCLICGWAILRWLDWRALQNMSRQLYNLAHATEYQEDHRSLKQTTRDSRVNLSLALSLMGLAALAWLFNIDSDKKTLILGEIINIQSLSTVVVFAKIALPLLTLISFVSIWLHTSTRHDHSHFDQSNPAWMVNLLRRYLFLCHRCGLEPVLVLDELDKLEEIDEFHNQPHKFKEKLNQPKPPTSLGGSAKPEKIDKLVLFLKALARLKASLGAEFLWILIGGSRIYGYLQEHRHEREDGNLGLLATVIHQEVVLGPIGFPDAYKYLRSQSKKRTAPPGEIITIQEDRNIAWVTWLRTYGNISTLTRVAEEMLNTPRLQDYPITPLAVLLAKYVRVLWSPRAMAEAVDLRTQLEYRDKVREEWVIAWVRSGMLDMANRFMKDPPPYDYLEKALREGVEKRLQRNLKDAEPPEIPAILTGDPQLLRLVGASMLYRRLVRDGFIVPQHGAWAMQPDIKFQNLPPLG